MEDMNNPTQSTGEGHPHHYGVNHTRPYFYVQPPTQPYHMYQWNMNPYGQYCLPVSALPYVRPYVAPYPYMSGYPGYAMPQAPIHPADYRRMFNPLLSSSACYDIHYRHHYRHIRKETASSEVQTEPNDPLINKLIGSLEGLRTNETSEKENNSPPPEMMTPSPSGMAKEEVNEPELKPLPQRQAPINRRLKGEPQPGFQTQLPSQPQPSLQHQAQPSLQHHPHPQAQPGLQHHPHPQAQPGLQPHPQAQPGLQHHPHPQAQPGLQPHPQAQPSLQHQAQPSLQHQPHSQAQPCLQHKLYTPLPSKSSGLHSPQQTSNSTVLELNNTASSQSSVDEACSSLKPGAQLGDSVQLDTWSLGSGIAVLPIDSSSVNEEDEQDMEACCHERPCVASGSADGCEELEAVNLKRSPGPLPAEPHRCGAKTQTWNLNRVSAEPHALDAAHCLGHNLEHKQVQNLHHAGALELIHPEVDVKVELPYRILRLPCDKVTTGMLQQGHPLWFMNPTASTSLPPHGYVSLTSSNSAYYYSYYPQTIQGATERQSVLAPSIDELSSRDELFSTDLDDDLVVRGRGLLSGGPVYIGGGKMAASVNSCSPDAPDDSGKENHAPEMATFSPVLCSKTCACCGMSLERKDEGVAFGGEKGGSLACRYPERARGREEGEVVEVQEKVEYVEEEEVSEEIEVFVSGPMPGPGKRSQHYPGTRPQPQAGPPPPSYPLPPLHLYSKRRSRRMCECEDHGGEMWSYDDQQGQGNAWGSDYCPPAQRKADKYKEKRQRNAPPRAYNGKPWREGPVAPDPDSWANGGAKYKPRSWRLHSGTHEQFRPQRRRPSQQRSRRAENDYEEGEVSRCHRGRGSTKRRGTRY